MEWEIEDDDCGATKLVLKRRFDATSRGSAVINVIHPLAQLGITRRCPRTRKRGPMSARRSSNPTTLSFPKSPHEQLWKHFPQPMHIAVQILVTQLAGSRSCNDQLSPGHSCSTPNVYKLPTAQAADSHLGPPQEHGMQR